MKKMKNVLITGGAGFIGSHLAESLLEDGARVVVVDDLSTGSAKNLAAFKNHPNFTFHRATILDRKLMAKLVPQADVVFHLAAAVGVQLIISSPVRTIETNIRGTEAILELAQKKRTKVVVASTSEVYGKSSKDSFSEDDDLVLGPTSRSRWSYAASKIVDEFLAKAYWKERKVPVVIVRLFNTVGPRQTGRYGMVIPSLVGQALKGEPIRVFGDGLQTRSFTYVADVVRALKGLAAHPAAVGEVFNIGHGKDISILDLAKLIKEKTGSKSEIRLVPYSEAYNEDFEDMRRRLPNIAKLSALIGYKPTEDLGGILDKVIESFRTSAGPKKSKR
jgi:UDP-glucose 4-epimerase